MSRTDTFVMNFDIAESGTLVPWNSLQKGCTVVLVSLSNLFSVAD